MKKSKFNKGDNVKYNKQVGTVNSIIEGVRGGYSYKITVNGQTRIVQENDLELYEDIENTILEDFMNKNHGDINNYKLFNLWLKMSRPLEKNIYSYRGSKTIFNPHQFKPLLRFLSSNSDERLFIADEVGVGKTIEAGIILTELFARGRLTYESVIIIVCPNALLFKWQKEMKDRFGFDFEIHNGKSIRTALNEYCNVGYFPVKHRHSIISIENFRNEKNIEILEKLKNTKEGSSFDMVIIDEAHKMRNGNTSSNGLGNILSELTEMMLMLSATPLNLEEDDLYNQMHILNPYIFSNNEIFRTLYAPAIKLNMIRKLLSKNDDESILELKNIFEEFSNDLLGKEILEHHLIKELIERINKNEKLYIEEIVKYERLLVSLSPLYYSFTRTRKREAIEKQIKREVLEISVSLSEKERQFSESFLGVIREYYLVQGHSPLVIGLIMNLFRRMISSCIPAIKEFLDDTIKKNKMISTENDFFYDEIEDDESEYLVYKELGQVFNSKFLELIKIVEKIENDTKYDELYGYIKKIFETKTTDQVIIFSFFVRTLEYLKKRLSKDGYYVEIICGKVPLESNASEKGRNEILEDFKNKKFQILLSSEVGGEGLDFQFCNSLINYDLPYNPMRIEQRIGRIDRFGQKSNKIFIGNFYIKDSVDEEIYERLYRRIGIVENGVGTLEPILGKKIAEFQNAILSENLSEEEKEELTIRIEKAVELARVETEEFEKRKSELLSDDYLNMVKTEISSNNSNFVLPDDIISLMDEFVKIYEKISFKYEGYYKGILTISHELSEDLRGYIRKNPISYKELSFIAEKKKNIKIIFDGSLADENPEYYFIPPTGSFVKFAIEKINKKGIIKRVSDISVSNLSLNNEIKKGTYLAFIYEVKLEGIKKEIDIYEVLISVEEKKIINISKETFQEIILKGNSKNLLSKDIDVYEYISLSREKIDTIIEEKKSVFNSESEYKINSNIVAIKRYTENKIKKLSETIENNLAEQKNEKQTELLKNQIEKEKIRSEKKIIELENKKKNVFGYSLEGIIIIHVGG